MNEVFQSKLQQAIDLLVKSSAYELPFSEDVINIAAKAADAAGFLTEGAFKVACENNPISTVLNFTRFAYSLGVSSGGGSQESTIITLDFAGNSSLLSVSLESYRLFDENQLNGHGTPLQIGSGPFSDLLLTASSPIDYVVAKSQEDVDRWWNGTPGFFSGCLFFFDWSSSGLQLTCRFTGSQSSSRGVEIINYADATTVNKVSVLTTNVETLSPISVKITPA